MAELPIPLEFRAETLQQVTRLLRSGESCALVGVGSSGKSNIARHLARADVRQEYFGEEAAATLVVYLNCKPYAHRPPADLYLHALDELCRAMDAHEGAVARQSKVVDELWQAAQAEPAVLALRNLDRAVAHLLRHGAARVILAVDDCDDLLAYADPALFSDLRALRDNHKVRLVYLTLTRREPAFLREGTPEFEELFELISAPGHTLAVGPYVEADGLLMLRRLAARQVPPRTLADGEARRLYELAGGHAGLLRSLFFATQYSTELAAASMSPEAWTRLAEHADVDGECRKIWDSLEPEEQADLSLIARGQTPSADGLRRLEKRGLVRLRLNRPAELFSPVFAHCLFGLAGLEATGASPANVAETITVEFPGAGTQARVNGTLVTNLLVPEFEILRCLTTAAPAGCSRAQLLEAMRVAEHAQQAHRAAGDPLRRLETYVHQLKAKLGPAGQFIQPDGDGFRLA